MVPIPDPWPLVANRRKEVGAVAKEGETYKCETCGLTVRVTKSDKKGVNIPYC